MSSFPEKIKFFGGKTKPLIFVSGEQVHVCWAFSSSAKEKKEILLLEVRGEFKLKLLAQSIVLEVLVAFVKFQLLVPSFFFSFGLPKLFFL